ncbi:MAG TPA: CHAT domain-containing tetratricopeptide repeat protein, partial [Candidatus Xenobia bacterium]
KTALLQARAALKTQASQLEHPVDKTAFMKALQVDQALMSLYIGLVRTMYDAGRLEDVITALETPEFTSLLASMAPAHLNPLLDQQNLSGFKDSCAELWRVTSFVAATDRGASWNTIADETGHPEDYRRALSAFAETGPLMAQQSPPTQIALLSNEGYSYEGLQDYQKAHQLYLQATRLAVTGHLDPDAELPSQSNLFRSYLRLKQIDRAEAVMQRIQSLESGLISPDYRWQVTGLEGRLLEAQGQYEAAAVRYRQAISTIEERRTHVVDPEIRKTYFRTRMGPYEGLMRVTQKLQRLPDFFSVSEQARSRVLADAMSRTTVHKGVPPELAGRAQAQASQQHQLGVALAEAKAARQRGLTVSTPDTASLAQSEQALTLDFVRQAPEYAQLQGAVTIDSQTAAHLLDADAVLLSYQQVGLGVVGCVLHPDGRGRVVWLGDAQTLDPLVLRFLAHIRDPQSHDWQPAGTALYQRLVAPFETDIKSARQLVVLPEGKLNYLPFAALTGPDGRYLVTRYRVTTEPSATVLSFCRQKNSLRHQTCVVYALGNVSHGNIPALPGTVTEAQDIKRIMPRADLVMEGAFTLQAVQSGAGAYDVVHFATHGMLNPSEPMKSAVITATDALPVSDIFNLDLHANLVVLSACETNLGKLYGGEEVVNLARAFMYAGTPSVMATLWSISDAS